MERITNDDLVSMAATLLSARKNGGYMSGDVGCALITDKANVYFGVCIDTCSGMGFCAEHSAIAAMVTAGESRIQRIVAVWKNENGTISVIPPCGRCREFIRQVNNENLDTDVILAGNKVVKVRELLPYYDWLG